MLITIVSFILILSVLVLVHELGHFLVAKFFKIKVEEFGFGFPPRVFGKKIGETIYSINLLPIGGFVKLYGEDDAGGGSLSVKSSKLKVESEDISRAFYARPLWQRITVVVAGVVMNFFLAVAIFSVLIATTGLVAPTENVIVSDVQEGSPAEISGIQAKDEIIKVNGQDVADSNEFINIVDENSGEEISLLVLRENEQFELLITPRVNPPEGEGALGVVISSVEIVRSSWIEAPYYGFIWTVKFAVLTVQGLGGIVSNLYHGEKIEGVGGPVAIAQLTGFVVDLGIYATLIFVAQLSISLAVLNILPIPALDGGRFFFQMIELVTRKKVSPRYEGYAHAAGLVILLSLMVLITVFDVGRLISGQSLIPDM